MSIKKATSRDKELPFKKTLEDAIKYIGNKETGILDDFRRVFQFYDEPKYFQYYAHLKNGSTKNNWGGGTAGGISFFSQEEAALKCLCEALERYALKNFDLNKIIYARANQLPATHLDLNTIAGFSSNQRKYNQQLKLNLHGKYGWVLGKEFPSLKKVYIPAQLVYLSYKRLKDESLLRIPISTGAACGTSFEAAIYRGVCEIIERDSFIITYLNRLQRAEVNLKASTDARIQKLLEIAKNYNLILKVYDLSSDIDIPSFLGLVIDPTNISVALSTGLKCGLNPTEAIIDALEEAFHTRVWIRKERMNFQGKLKNMLQPKDIVTRGLLWAHKSTLPKLSFLLNSKKVIDINSYTEKLQNSPRETLKMLQEKLSMQNMKIYFVDITPNIKILEKTKFKVIMALIPEMQPLYLNEKFPYLGGNRLYESPLKLGLLKNKKDENSLNKFPHPFL